MQLRQVMDGRIMRLNPDALGFRFDAAAPEAQPFTPRRELRRSDLDGMPTLAATIVSPARQRREIVLHFRLSRAYTAADYQLALLGNANGHAQPCELVAGH